MQAEPYPPRPLTDTELAWFAGLYEGEGSTWCREYVTEKGTVHRAVRIQIAMTDRDVLERVKALFPMTNDLIVHVKAPPRKPLYLWVVSRRALVATILRMILPYLGERRTEQAFAVLEVAESTEGGLGSQWRNRTHCMHGHLFDEQNTAWSRRADGGTHRRCRACERERSREGRERKRNADAGDVGHGSV